ncbi:hypothetical protein AMAG_05686 [Allomyces macrogynus ATCC 38327]|uniref:Uncharacterized protein n=1 Tax=Allomyces macrogynus (strain ATCC 38327) TaxID=578462 RepID=A0A0L0SD01_ALLM3|nr:hypothetical protein AMAG_05686 [Allomyces macrogynus ATCC 38327]|eukprot:KNE60275.1 hypothetical protein AMAG_05686 [Allomyces macrogynus ATCC 38327]
MISAFASPRKSSQRHERQFDWVLASLQRPLRNAVHAVVGSSSSRTRSQSPGPDLYLPTRTTRTTSPGARSPFVRWWRRTTILATGGGTRSRTRLIRAVLAVAICALLLVTYQAVSTRHASPGAVATGRADPAPPAQIDFDDDLPDDPIAPIRAASPPLLSSSDLRPGKYLTYLPHGGYQAQRQALEHALVLAKALSRNLLVPPLLVGPGPVHSAPMLDLQRTLLDVPVDRLRSWRGEFQWDQIANDEDVLFTTTFAEMARWWAAAGKVSWWGQGEREDMALGTSKFDQEQVNDDADPVRAAAVAVMRAVAGASSYTGAVSNLDMTTAAMAERGVRMPLDPAEPERKPHVHLVPGNALITDDSEAGSRSIRIDELVEQTVDADLVVVGSLASRDRVLLTRPAWVEMREKVVETTARPKLSPEAQSAALSIVKLLGGPGRFAAAHFWPHEDNDDAAAHRVAAAIKAQLALNPSLEQHSSPLCQTSTGPTIFLIANTEAQVRAISQHFPCTITLATFLSPGDETGIGRHLRAAPTAWAAVDGVVASAAAAFVGAEGNAFSDQVVRQWVLRACGTVKGGVGKKCAARAVRV